MLRDLWKGLKKLRSGKTEWGFNERRELVRVSCDYPVECKFGPTTRPGRVLDISLGGMKVECEARPAIGQDVRVSFGEPDSDYEPVECEVGWLNAGEGKSNIMGLCFSRGDEGLGDSWVATLFKELGFNIDDLFQKRQFVRVDCDLKVKVKCGSESLEGRIANLGARGAFLEVSKSLEEGKEMTLCLGPLGNLRELTVPGTVRTARHENDRHFLGVEFKTLSDETASLVGDYLRLLHSSSDSAV